MSSILTNVAAMTALKSLQMTTKNIETVQARISTGLRVNEASDNAAYWSIATTLRSDNSALSTVQDALGLGASKVDVAYTGMTSAAEFVDEIKSKLVAAKESTVDKAKVQAEIAQLQGQLRSIADSAQINGDNWLNVDSSLASFNATKDIVSSFNRSTAGTVSVATISFDGSNIELFDANTDSSAGASGLLDFQYSVVNTAATPVTVDYSISTLDITLAAVDDTVIDDMISTVDRVLQDMTTAASDLGSIQRRIELQTQFVGNLMDAVDRSIGQLVDADMTEESTKLQALQVQQQLGVQSLSIANANAQTILALFGQ